MTLYLCALVWSCDKLCGHVLNKLYFHLWKNYRHRTKRNGDLSWDANILNDTHRKKLCFTQFNEMIYWNRTLAVSDFFHAFIQSINSIHTMSNIKEYRCLNKVIHQIDRNWAVLPFNNFYAKLKLVFVLRWLAWLIWNLLLRIFLYNLVILIKLCKIR